MTGINERMGGAIFKVEMHRLYNIYGTFAEVGRRMGRSASSVAKYIKLQGTPSIVRHTFKEVVRG